MLATGRLLTLAAFVMLAGCGSQPKAAPREVTVWRHVGSWSGHGSTQTESFVGDTGSLRVDWATSHESSPGAGAFRLTVHSAVSGRAMKVAVDHHGVGRGSAYVWEEPRMFHISVESANVDWSFAVEEASPGNVAESTRR